MTMRSIPPRSARRAFTLLEMMFAVGILSVVVVMVFSSMIVFGREYKSILTQTRLQDQSRYLMLRLSYLSTTATSLEIFNSGDGLRIVHLRTADDGTQSFHTVEFVYENGDGNDATLADNYLMEQEVDDDGKVIGNRRFMLRLVSKVGANKIFQPNGKDDRERVEMIVRAGDRTNPTDREAPLSDTAVKTAIQDDALTGPGYQSFVARSCLSPAT